MGREGQDSFCQIPSKLLYIISTYNHIVTRGHSWPPESLEYSSFHVVLYVLVGPLRSKHQGGMRHAKALLRGRMPMKAKGERGWEKAGKAFSHNWCRPDVCEREGIG